jgi:hypothetical protein
MFKLTEFTEAHVASVTNRQETHGDEKVPAVSIGLRITAANYLLDTIDPLLRLALFKNVQTDKSRATVLPLASKQTQCARLGCQSLEPNLPSCAWISYPLSRPCLQPVNCRK